MEREELHALLVKHDERLRNIYSSLGRVEKHLEKLNGKVSQHDTSITEMKTIGAITVIAMPILITIIMRII